MEKKELKISKKSIIRSAAIFLGAMVFLLLLTVIVSGGDFEIFFDDEIMLHIGLLAVVFVGCIVYMIYLRKTNILYYGDFGFSVKGTTYSFNQVTMLKTVYHRQRYGHTVRYHIYVEGNVVFKFSRSYENKDDFVALLQKNGVRIEL